MIPLTNSLRSRGRWAASTFRIVGNGAVAQALMTIQVPASSAVRFGVRRVFVTHAPTDAIGLAAIPNEFRFARTSAVPSGGTELAKASLYRAAPGNTSDPLIVIRGANASDGGAATAITNGTTISSTGVIARAFGSRIAGAMALDEIAPSRIELWNAEREGDVPPFTVPGESTAYSILVANPVAANNAATDNYIVNIEWEEFIV